MMTDKTKKFTFGMAYQAYGYVTTNVPIDFTQEQAEQYVRDHFDEYSLPEKSEYLTDSAEPDFEHSGFWERRSNFAKQEIGE